MDDMKLFAKNESELKTLIQEVKIYSQDIGIEFGIEKCTMQARKAGNDTWQKESNNQIKKKSERSEKRKPTNTWEYWKLTPSNKWRWKEKIKKKIISGEPE